VVEGLGRSAAREVLAVAAGRALGTPAQLDGLVVRAVWEEQADTTCRQLPSTNLDLAKHHSCQPPFVVETLKCAAASHNASHHLIDSDAETRVDPACGSAGSTCNRLNGFREPG
jgi:hypothetical protein